MIRRLMLFFLLGWGAASAVAAEEIPTSPLPGFAMAKFAGSDLIKHPTGMTFTADGKLLVVESHTHFRPPEYEGPPSDRIVWLRDTDGDGAADTRSVFFESDLVATMDIATHPETGGIYIATRNEILRVWDRDGDGRADADTVERRLVFLDTTADYPHNGLSGLCFDDAGGLFFGMGENYGADYILRGSDETSASGGGEGGNIWHTNRDGGKLRRYATGFWNPFGVCTAPGGHVFATDNDPSSRPPSRLHQVIEDGDHGYQYRYGRSGHHPFTSWNGELAGTLPMLHATGEAPCDVIFHRGNLLIASWADHTIEHYPLNWKKTHFTTERRILAQGGAEFRPVAFAVGPDGALYVSDWVKKDYNLHGHGAVWRIEGWEPEDQEMPSLSGNVVSRNGEFDPVDWVDPWRAPALIRALDQSNQFQTYRPLSSDPEFDARQRAILLLAGRKHDPGDAAGIAKDGLADPDPEVRLLALKWICDEKLEKYRAEVETVAADPPSPALFHAAVTTIARLDGQPVDDKPIQRLIGARLQDGEASASVKRAAFQVLADREKFLSVRDLRALYESAPNDDEFRIGVLLTLQVHADTKAARAFASELVASGETPDRLRPFAREVAENRAIAGPDPAELALRPQNNAVPDWSAFLDQLPASFAKPFEGDHGRLVFHRHCAVCHRALGFGRQGGPDLSTIGERGPGHILGSILDPSAEIAPQYEPWQMTLVDGSQLLAFQLGEEGPKHFYADIAGNEILINNRDIVTRKQVSVSLMPPGLVNQMSNDELRDLMLWLASLK